MKKLTKMIIAIAIAATLVGCQNQQANIANGARLAREFVQDAFPGYEIVHISCASMDTNGDGYLRATAVIRKGDALRVLRLDVSESGDPFQIQKAATVSLSPEQPFDSRF